MGVTSSHSRPQRALRFHPPIPKLCGWKQKGHAWPSTYTHVRQQGWRWWWWWKGDGDGIPSKASSCTDSPLCSPKKTSLNFLRGFPKSPPADMVADNAAQRGLFFLFLYVLIGSASPPSWVRRGILLSSQNDGNAARHPPVISAGLRACATSPLSARHLFFLIFKRINCVFCF